MGDKANYITCPQGHKVYVIWSDQRKTFGFTCDECGQHSERAISLHGLIEIRLVNPPVLDTRRMCIPGDEPLA